jgi:GntR family transcriptional regulator
MSSHHSPVQQGPLPYYHQILQVLRARLAAGDYQPGDRLPTDEELTRQFSVSRNTARAAVQHLVNDGLVRRYPGRGSFVVKSRPGPESWGVRSLEDVIGRSFADQFRVISVGLAEAADEPAAAAALQAEIDDSLFLITALRSSDGNPYTYSRIFVPRDISLGLPADFADRAGSSPVLNLIEEHCGIPAQRAIQVAGAATANAELARHLAVPVGAALLVLERTYYSREGRPVEHAQIFCRPDRYRQTVEFIRQRTSGEGGGQAET